MVKFLDELMNYKADEEATAPTNERLAQFYHFLEKPDYTKFFVWVEFENPELRWSFERAPLFYEAGKYLYFWLNLAFNSDDLNFSTISLFQATSDFEFNLIWLSFSYYFDYL